MATASRYAATGSDPYGTGLAGINAPQTLQQNTSQNGSQQTNTNQTTNTLSNQTSTTNSTQHTNTQNMTGSSLAALELLIQQLLGGGTQDMAQQRAERQAEINNVSQTRAGYTKEAAFNDAQGLIAQTMRQSLEQLIPGINRAAQGAGTSQSSMRALLTQKAAENAAEAAAAQGMTAAVNYGNINANLSNVLEVLTRPDNTVTESLLAALNTARGAVQNTTTTGTSTTDTVGQQTQNTTGQSNTNTNQNSSSYTGKNIGTDVYMGSRANTNNNVDGLVYYGPQTSTLDLAARGAAGSDTSIADLLAAAGGNSGSGWSGGFSF